MSGVRAPFWAFPHHPFATLDLRLLPWRVVLKGLLVHNWEYILDVSCRCYGKLFLGLDPSKLVRCILMSSVRKPVLTRPSFSLAAGSCRKYFHLLCFGLLLVSHTFQTGCPFWQGEPHLVFYAFERFLVLFIRSSLTSSSNVDF